MTMKADVVVAGLGPGGAIAASELTLSGFRVVGLDPLRSYRKACGDAVVAREEYESVLRKSDSIRWKISRVRINVNGEEVRTIKFNRPVWYIIDKGRLVNYLREIVEAEGGQIIHKTFIKNIIKSDIVIDARGPYAHPPPKHILAYRYIVKTKDWDTDTVLLNFLPDKSGLFWVFPSHHGENYVNIGGGFKNTNIFNTKNFILKYIKLQFNEFRIISESGAPIAVYSEVEPVNGNILRVGEAGGLINSAGGEGIRMALLSGMAAGRALDFKDPAYYYRRAVRRLAREARLSRILLRVVEASPGDLGSSLLRGLPEFFWRSFLSGELSIGVVLSAVLSSPRIASIVARSLSSSLF